VIKGHFSILRKHVFSHNVVFFISDEEEYEDLMSVRETMASLLIRECSTGIITTIDVNTVVPLL
jgi:hypothetical protein